MNFYSLCLPFLFSSVQSISHVQLFVTPWTVALQASLSITNSRSLLKFIEFDDVHWIDDAIQPSHPLSSLSSPAWKPSQHQGLFKWVSSSHLVAKVLELQLQHQWKSESEVALSCPTLCDPMICSLPCSSIHGIFQARILEWVAISFSRRSSRPSNGTWVSHIVGRFFTICVTGDAATKPKWKWKWSHSVVSDS